MAAYLGWIVAAFLGGYLLACLQTKRRPSLRKEFARVECFQGRGYREIVFIAGAKPNSVISLADGRTLKTWKEQGYSITLAFDAKGICLGVMDECD